MDYQYVDLKVKMRKRYIVRVIRKIHSGDE